MDPLSQGVVGALAGQSASKTSHIRIAGLLAFFAGMMADLDVLIQSSQDPLLSLAFHRHFTHSLIFIPVGGLLAAAIFFALFSRRYISFKQTYFYCTAGYATHALLDACTSYGTQLLWPFSDMRIAWNNISIIDPLFTLPLLALIITAHIKKNVRVAHVAVVFGLSYLLLGLVQNQRALNTGIALADSRGHKPVRIEAKASLGNIILWKTIYEYDGRFYVDAVSVLGKAQIFEGESVKKLNILRDFPLLNPASQQALDIERFRWFSADFLSVDKIDSNVIVDMRYSMLPNSADALWGIRIDEHAEDYAHIKRVNFQKERGGKEKELFYSLWRMIAGGN